MAVYRERDFRSIRLVDDLSLGVRFVRQQKKIGNARFLYGRVKRDERFRSNTNRGLFFIFFSSIFTIFICLLILARTWFLAVV